MLLEVAGVTKRFGGLVANKDVGFNVSEGEIVGLIGPNGAGKTTMFSMISGFIKPDAGRITLAGKQINGLPPHKVCQLGIARTFQITRPFLSMTVHEAVTLGALNRVQDVAAAEKIAADLLERTNLSSRAQMYGRSLSVIDRKALEVARALATQPKLLLLDEVVAGLNATEVDRVVALIQEVRRSGVTILIVEHVLKAVMSLCERIIVLNHGEKLAEGTPQEIVSNQKVIEAYLGESYSLAGTSKH